MSHEELLVCNLKGCRQRIRDSAWVTSCSHIFCDGEGGHEFHGTNACPACGSPLSGKLDVVRVNLNPTEGFKSMVLAGRRPNVVLEICSRALAFWTYQISQERRYQQHMESKSKVFLLQVEGHFQQEVQGRVMEISTLREEISSAKVELAKFKKRCSETMEMLLERERHQQKLQNSLNQLRLHTSTIHNVQRFSDGETSGAAGDAAGVRMTPGRHRDSEQQSEFLLEPSYFNRDPLGGASACSGNFDFQFAAAPIDPQSENRRGDRK